MANIVSITIAIFCTLLVLYAVPANSSSEEIEECPSYNTIAANLSNIDELITFNLNLKNSMWNSQYPKLTKKGEAYKKVALYMINSDIPSWQMVADTATSWVWTYLPQYKIEPDFTAFANMITLSNTPSSTPHYCELVDSTVNSLVANAGATDPYTIATTLKNAGCHYDKLPESTIKSNAKDSYSQALTLWGRVGSLYPVSYQKAVLDLYQSNVYMDQLIAVIATASLTDHLQNMGTTFNITSALQVYQLQGVSKIPNYCCTNLKNDLDGTLHYTTEGTLSSALYVKQQAGC